MPDNILLVEDEYALRMTLGDRLRKAGYGVDCTADGDEGLTKATNEPFDLIILDLMLPKRDGLAVCRDIRSAGLITPILMLTARGRTVDKVDGLGKCSTSSTAPTSICRIACSRTRTRTSGGSSAPSRRVRCSSAYTGDVLSLKP